MTMQKKAIGIEVGILTPCVSIVSLLSFCGDSLQMNLSVCTLWYSTGTALISVLQTDASLPAPAATLCSVIPN